MKKVVKCYFYGKALKDKDRKIRITEDPDDLGFLVSVCEECYEEIKDV